MTPASNFPVPVCKGDLFLYLTFSLALMVVCGATGGLFLQDSYLLDAAGWRSQARGQDMVDLLLAVPLLITGSILNFQGKKTGYFLMGGALFFLIYTYTIFCFSLHYNSFFLLYCAILGLSFYLLVWLLRAVPGSVIKNWFRCTLRVGQVSSFFISLVILFSSLWLKDLVPALWHGALPESLHGIGLLTNPVEVLDLCFLLPGLFIVAWLLRKGTAVAYQLSPMLLLFVFLMAVNICLLLVIAYIRREPGVIPLLITFAALSGWALFLSYRFGKALL